MSFSTIIGFFYHECPHYGRFRVPGNAAALVAVFTRECRDIPALKRCLEPWAATPEAQPWIEAVKAR